MSMHWVDGIADGRIPADDRGLLYGDGVFRTGLVWGGELHQSELQFQVLQADSDALGLELNLDALREEVAAATQNVSEGVLRVTLSRRQQERGYRPQWPAPTRRILTMNPLPDRPSHLWQRGISVGVATQSSMVQGPLSRHKHLNRLPEVLAQRFLGPGSGLQEVLCMDEADQLRCGSMTSVFLKSPTGWLAPCEDSGALAGLSVRMLSALMRELGHAVEHCLISREMLVGAEEMFVANALIGVWPVGSVHTCGPEQSPELMLRLSAPGPETETLMHRLEHPLLRAMLQQKETGTT